MVPFLTLLHKNILRNQQQAFQNTVEALWKHAQAAAGCQMYNKFNLLYTLLLYKKYIQQYLTYDVGKLRPSMLTTHLADAYFV